jgi:hypothetical protein
MEQNRKESSEEKKPLTEESNLQNSDRTKRHLEIEEGEVLNPEDKQTIRYNSQNNVSLRY